MVGGKGGAVGGRPVAAPGERGDAAAERSRQAGIPVSPTCLAKMRVGQAGEVIAVEAPDQAGYRRLFALGLAPGATLRLIQRFPTYVFVVGRTTIAVDAEMAAGIRVAASSSRFSSSAASSTARRTRSDLRTSCTGSKPSGRG